jgi:subtilisin family serine protease
MVVIDTGWQIDHSEFSNIGFSGSGGGSILEDCTNINGCITQLAPTSNYDCNGHGTAVTSVLAGKTFGVSKGVTLWGLRASPDCSLNLTATAIVNAIQYAHVAAEPIGEVINMSFIFQGVNTIVDQWVNIAIDNGVTVVVAAGNAANGIGNGSDACNFTPAHNSRAIRVASTDSNDTRVSDSNYGSCVDIFAPGGGVLDKAILSADNGGALYAAGTPCAAVFPNTTAACYLSGTSFATPIVSGIAALYLQNNLYADPATVKSVILANATAGAVQNAGAGSPNLLAYVGVPGNSSGGVVGGGGGGVVPANIVSVIVDTLLLQ